MDVSTFRQLRGAFKRPDRYPDAVIQHYLDLATNQLNAQRWATLLDEGTCDYVAHFLVINKRNEQADERGGVSGNAAGRLTSKSVGGVSVNYAVGDTEEEDGGHWNTTTYGSAFLRNARMVGSGGVQLGIGCAPPLSGPPWPGPPTQFPWVI